MKFVTRTTFGGSCDKWNAMLNAEVYYQFIKDSKVDICRGGRSTITVEAITVETIAVEVIAVHSGGGGSINDRC